MRSEAEMFDLILGTARRDERIRAVILSGSRANPAAPRDLFQDYDILYVVTDVAAFTRDAAWADRFGERIIMQLPEAMEEPPAAGDGSFVYLMQFTDGNRLDLTLYPLGRLANLEDDGQNLLLLDKDGIVPPLKPPAAESYLPAPPTAKAYADCCNEFWWVCPYVAKGLWREEIIYARRLLDEVVRPQLMKMLDWHVGAQSDLPRQPGKYGKYLQQCLEPAWWALLLETYAGAGYAETWAALEAGGRLFRLAAQRVAARYSFGYPLGDDERVSAHLRHVRALPRDASAIY
jgi:aminoglycoside 6-adenylyltransferase